VRVRRINIVADGFVEPGPRFRIAGWPEAFPLDGNLAPGRTRLRAVVRVDQGAIRLEAR